MEKYSIDIETIKGNETLENIEANSVLDLYNSVADYPGFVRVLNYTTDEDRELAKECWPCMFNK